MNATTDDVKDMLEAESSLDLVFATNLFVGKEPTSPDDCVTLFDTTGFPPLLTLDGSGGYYYPSIQVRIRNRSYPTAMALAQAIVLALHGRHQEVWNGTTYGAIICTNDPGLLDWDANNRCRVVTNFNIQRS